ncbi:TonB-dependent receptor [Pseudomonadota bacterium]|nr:TonB-dependent receptor [Pseudomonadota bacterium]
MKPSPRHFALRTTVRLTLATVAFSTLSVHASETLEPVTVTANRMPSQNVLAPNTVITRADIERLQINDLPSLLSRQPGIDVTATGGMGKVSGLYMRGSNSGHTLILVDGVKWHSATSGSSAIQHFPVEQIERIEIVRGPRSGLYGAEAIGGVIQIFTRKGGEGDIKPYFKAGYGTHNSSQIAAGISGGNYKTTYNLSINHAETDGINAQKNNNPDKDGYRNKSIAASIQHHLTDKIDIGANFIRSEGLNQYDGDRAKLYKVSSVQQVMGVNSKVQVTDKWLTSINLSESRDQSHNFTNGTAVSTFSTRHRFANVTNTFDLTPEHTINLGLDYDVDDVNSTTNYDETSRDNKAAFISWQANVGKQSWLVSARYDDNEAYGGNDTGTAEWGYLLQEGLMFTANIGTGFKAPSFNDLYYPGFSNPDLKPEKSKNYGIGLTGEENWGQWGVHTYQNKVRDLMVYDEAYIKHNIEEAKIKGVEFDVATSLDGWDLSANASFLKPKNEQTGNILARRSQRIANIMLDKKWGAISAGTSWKLQGHSYDRDDNKTRLGGYGLLDVRMAYQVSDEWSLEANLSNVLDKRYETASGYNSLDRTVMVSISYQP